MSFKEKLKTLLQTKFVKKTGTVFSLIAITSALAFGTIACTPEQSVQDPPSSPITTPSDDLKPGDGIITPGDETTDPTDPDITDPGITDPENPDVTDPETPTDPEDPGVTDPETPTDPDATDPEDPEQTLLVGDIIDEQLTDEALFNLTNEKAEEIALKFQNAHFPDEQVSTIWVHPSGSGAIYVLLTNGTEKRMAFIDSSSAETQALKAAMENAKQKIVELSDLDSSTEIQAENKADVLEALEIAKQLYLSDLTTLANAAAQTWDFSEIMPISLAKQTDAILAQQFGGAETVYVGAFTDPMSYAAAGNIASSSCQMAYALTLNTDGKLDVYSVTVAEGETDLSGALDITFVGNFEAGTTLTDLPALTQPQKSSSFEEVYNEVFGENYEFVPFEDYMQSLAERVFSTSTDVKFLVAEAKPDSFVIYANGKGSFGEDRLLQGTLKTGTYATIYAPILYNLYDLTRQSEAAGGFKQYMQQVYENCADASSARAELETISADLNQSVRVSSGLVGGNFDTTGPVTNTTDDIDFSAYAEKYTPEGATPLKCYVGSFKGYVYDDPLNPFFNTGYIDSFPVVVIYSQDGSNELIIESFDLCVPRHRDYTNEQMYAFGLGEINETYVKLNGETTVIDDPILSEELLANLNAEKTL